VFQPYSMGRSPCRTLPGTMAPSDRTGATATRTDAAHSALRQPPALPLGIGIVGCGNIAGPYARTIASHPDEIRLVAATDIDPARAAAFATEHGVRAVPTLEALLADPAVDIVVNLTFHHAHYAVSRQALEAGRHVYSEKPMALDGGQAHELVSVAERHSVRLACAPSTFLGEAQQTAGAIIRRGELGTVRAIYANVNWGRIETWHPAPIPFYDVGVLFDVGVYPLTVATAFIGPAVAVDARGWDLMPERRTLDGTPFRIGSPDLIVAGVELASGAVIRLIASFYVGKPSRFRGSVEFHGDRASLALESFQEFDAAVEVGAYAEEYEPVPLIRPADPQTDTDWARGLADFAMAIVERRRARVTGEQAAHVVDILTAARTSMREGRRVEVTSTFEPPPLMEWAEAAASGSAG
jgi:predicted dehydrogenase